MRYMGETIRPFRDLVIQAVKLYNRNINQIENRNSMNRLSVKNTMKIRKIFVFN